MEETLQKKATPVCSTEWEGQQEPVGGTVGGNTGLSLQDVTQMLEHSSMPQRHIITI